MPTAHQSGFAVAAFSGVSEVHECLKCLHLALLAANEKSPGCKSPPLIWLLFVVSAAQMGPFGNVTS